MTHVTSPPIGCRLTTGLRSPVCRCGVVHGADRAAFRGPRPCDPPGGGVKTATRSCWLTAGWTCACPSLPVEPLVKAQAFWLGRTSCATAAARDGQGAKSKAAKGTCAKNMLVSMYIRANLQSSVFIPLNCHKALRAHAA